MITRRLRQLNNSVASVTSVRKLDNFIRSLDKSLSSAANVFRAMLNTGDISAALANDSYIFNFNYFRSV